MLGFKRFDSAAVTISGIELMQKIQKHQFKTGTLGGRSATMPEVGTRPCWPPDPNFRNPKNALSTYKLCTGAS
jgi:hypothetical protein